MHTSEEDLRDRIQNRTGTAAVAPASFYTFQNMKKMSATNCELPAIKDVMPGKRCQFRRSMQHHLII